MEWLAKTFARAFVRRLAYVAVAAVLMGLGAKSYAQSGSYPDQGIALTICTSHASQARARGLSPTSTGDCYLHGNGYNCEFINTVGQGRSCGLIIGINHGISYTWPTGKTCSSRNESSLADAQPWYSEPSNCISGCQVYGERYSLDNGGVTVYGMRDRSYTGQTCAPAKPTNDIQQAQDEAADAKQQKQPECTALGNGQTSCVKPNGDHCATSSTGKTFCWSTNETGKKTDGEQAQVKDKEGVPVTPPNVNIQDKDWQRTEGHKATACVNATCTTYNVTNYTSVPGGTAKNSTRDNNANGTGNTSGNGTPSKGSGNGGDGDGDEGEGDSATDSGNCTTPPGCVGDTLKCLHLRFTWKNQCNTSRAEITNGQGCGESDVPVCAGNSCKAEEYASVLQQWKARCAVQAMGEGMAARAARIDNSEDAGVVEGVWGGEPSGTGMTLRRDLINVGGAGNLLPDISIAGYKWEVPPGFYDAISAIKMVIIAMCTVMAMFIVGRNI